MKLLCQNCYHIDSLHNVKRYMNAHVVTHKEQLSSNHLPPLTPVGALFDPSEGAFWACDVTCRGFIVLKMYIYWPNSPDIIARDKLVAPFWMSDSVNVLICSASCTVSVLPKMAFHKQTVPICVAGGRGGLHLWKKVVCDSLLFFAITGKVHQFVVESYHTMWVYSTGSVVLWILNVKRCLFCEIIAVWSLQKVKNNTVQFLYSTSHPGLFQSSCFFLQGMRSCMFEI